MAEVEIKKDESINHVSTARVRRHLDNINLNSVVINYIERVKNPAEGSEEAKYSSEEREQILKELSRKRIRFSSESSFVASRVCDLIIRQIINLAISNAMEEKKKILRIRHIHSEDVKKLPIYSLISTLPDFINLQEKSDEEREEEEREALIASTKSKVEKEMRKNYERKKSAKNDKSRQKESVEEKTHDKEDEKVQLTDNHTSNFKFYVTSICKSIKLSDEAFESIRFSSTIKIYLSNLIIQFLERLSDHIYFTIDMMKVKTVNWGIIMHTISTFTMDTSYKRDEKLIVKKNDKGKFSVERKLITPKDSNFNIINTYINDEWKASTASKKKEQKKEKKVKLQKSPEKSPQKSPAETSQVKPQQKKPPQEVSQKPPAGTAQPKATPKPSAQLPKKQK